MSDYTKTTNFAAKDALLTGDPNKTILGEEIDDEFNNIAIASATKTDETRNLTAGAGLTGGGTLAADRSFAVGAGTGITVNADDVAVDTAHLDTLYEGIDATILKQADVDDTPVNGVTTAPVSSNWAYDHENAADPHPGYLTTAEGDAAYEPLDAAIVKSDEAETITANWTFSGDPTISGKATFSSEIVEGVHTLSGTTPSIDPANGTVQTWNLTGDSTPTIALAGGEYVTLVVGTPSHTIDWGSEVDEWVGGSPPTLATAGSNIIELWHIGSTTFGAYIGASS